FMETLRAGREMRKRVFDTLEHRNAHAFGNGGGGVKVYEDFFSVCAEGEGRKNRFFPLLNPARPRGEADFGTPKAMTNQDRMTAVEDGRGSSWGWISATCVAAAILGALILGSNAL